jgi:hypothetical protein
MNALKLLLPAILVSHATAAAVFDDPWDTSRGATVLRHSGTGNGEITNMFGTSLSHPLEAGNTLFQDFQSQGFVHWLEWQSANPIHLIGYVLNMADDETVMAGNRGISEFRLYGRLLETDSWTLLDTFSPSVHPYGVLEHTTYFPEQELQQFRAEFVQYSNEISGGPRIVELDALVIPEPSALPLIALSPLAIFMRRKPSK